MKQIKQVYSLKEKMNLFLQWCEHFQGKIEKPENNTIINSGEAQQILSISKSTFYRLRDSAKLTTSKHGNVISLKLSDLAEYYEKSKYI